MRAPFKVGERVVVFDQSGEYATVKTVHYVAAPIHGWFVFAETDSGQVWDLLQEDENAGSDEWQETNVPAGDEFYVDVIRLRDVAPFDGARVRVPGSDDPDAIFVVGHVEDKDEFPIKLSSPASFGGSQIEALRLGDVKVVDNPRLVPEEVYERRRRRAREAAAGRVDPSEYQVSEEFMTATGSVAAQLRGEREEVIPAKKRKQKGKKRIVIERSKNLRSLKTKLLR